MTELLLMASVYLATPMGPGKVPYFGRECDRIRIYDKTNDVNWVLCINGVYQFPKNGKPQDRSLPKHQTPLI
jgi:hypothetical protein